LLSWAACYEMFSHYPDAFFYRHGGQHSTPGTGMKVL
jgi:hypothetical protein